MRKILVMISVVFAVCCLATAALAAGNGTVNPLGEVRVESGNGTINPLIK